MWKTVGGGRHLALRIFFCFVFPGILSRTIIVWVCWLSSGLICLNDLGHWADYQQTFFVFSSLTSHGICPPSGWMKQQAMTVSWVRVRCDEAVAFSYTLKYKCLFEDKQTLDLLQNEQDVGGKQHWAFIRMWNTVFTSTVIATFCCFSYEGNYIQRNTVSTSECVGFFIVFKQFFSWSCCSRKLRVVVKFNRW